jgi:hypothetical protein
MAVRGMLKSSDDTSRDDTATRRRRINDKVVIRTR